MKKTCPRCGCKNALPENPPDPYPCMNCGANVLAKKKLSYQNCRKY